MKLVFIKGYEHFFPRLPLVVLCSVPVVYRCQIFGQFNGAVIKSIQLLHDEVEVRREAWRCGETPEHGGDRHEDGDEEKDVGKELRVSEKMRTGLNKTARNEILI